MSEFLWPMVVPYLLLGLSVKTTQDTRNSEPVSNDAVV